MPLFASFVGPAYRARSETIAADALVNLFTETTEIAEEQKKTTFYGTPGLKKLLTVAETGCRGGFSQDGRTFMVVGNALYEANVTGASVALRGNITDDGKPVSFASNGRGGEQLAIVGGGELKIFSLTGNTLSAAVVLPLANAPVVVDFIDGYFLLLEKNQIRVWYSALENGLSWDGLDYFARSETSDNLVGMVVARNRVWVFGSLTSQVYYNSGDSDNPFVPYPGSLMHEGAVSPWACLGHGDDVCWMNNDEQGCHRILLASDYNPATISTAPIDFALSGYSTVADAEFFSYEQDGHGFIVLTFPSASSAGATWVYDLREKNWHQRSTWDDALAIEKRWRARGFASDTNGLLVGDVWTGNLYLIDMDTFTDNGATIRRRRRAPYLSSENQWFFLDRFELGMQAGVGLVAGQGSDPEAMLAISRNNAATWTIVGTAKLGKMGETDARAIWRRLGRARVDRLVLEVTMTDPVRCVWGPGAWLRGSPGSGAL